MARPGSDEAVVVVLCLLIGTPQGLTHDQIVRALLECGLDIGCYGRPQGRLYSDWLAEYLGTLSQLGLVVIWDDNRLIDSAFARRAVRGQLRDGVKVKAWEN